MTIPPLSDEQRQQARSAATQARRRRADVKQALRSGERTLAEVLTLAEQDDVIAVGERIVAALWALVGVEVPLPIPRLTFAESMRRYGNDKPDLRFGCELVECADFFAETPFRVFHGVQRERGLPL